MLAVSLKSVWAHKRRLIGTFVAVVLGVAFLSGTLILGDTLRSNFNQLFTDANGSTDVVVRSATKVNDNLGQSNRARVDGALAADVQRVDGVADAVPYIDGYGQLIGRDGKGIGGAGPPTRAANWVTVPSLNPYRVVEGRAPQADDEAVINRGAANSGNLHVGDTATLLTPKPVQIRIVGISTFGTADGFGSGTFTGLTLHAAQQLLTDDPSRVTEIRVKAAAGVTPDQLAARVRATVPANVEAITGTELAVENFANINSDFLGIVRNGLLMFAVIALLVAAFSIFNTFSILVAQRGRESALLRALGATRRQVIATGVVETLTIGIAGSTVGWFAGLGLAGLLKGLFDAFGFALPAGGFVIEPTSTVLAIAAGIGATAVAGVVPVVRASRVPPIAALRELATEAPILTRRRVLVGTAVVGLGAGAVVAAASGQNPGLGLLGALGCLAGIVVLGPVVARPAVAVLGRPIAAARGLTGRLAQQNASRHPRRTSATAAALLIGVSIVALFTVFGASLKASAAKGIDDSLRADLVVDTPGYGGRSGNSGFSPQLTSDLKAVPGVRAVTEVRGGSAVIGGSIHAVTALTAGSIDDVFDLDVRAGSFAGLDADGIAVSQDTANERHWSVGTPVTVTYPDGTDGALTVAAVYGHAQLVGDYVVSTSVWTPHNAQAIDRQVLLDVAPGADESTVHSAVEAVAKPYGNARVQTQEEFRTSATEGVNTILGLVYVMLFLAIVIALMGIANTLSLAIHERARELGLLRAVGQTRRQARSMVRWESVIIAVFGTVIGVALGTFLGWGVVTASAGSNLSEFAAPPSQLAVFVVVGALAGTIAAIRPARRVARLDVLTAIASE